MSEAGAPQKKAFSQLHALGPSVMDALDERLTRGESGLQIARWIQQDLLQLVTAKTESLKKTIERYRAQELRPRLEAAARATVEAAPLHVLARSQTDALSQLEALAEQQNVRVQTILEREKQIPGGILLKDVSGEIRLLKDILETISKIQLETGRIRRAAKSITGTVIDEDGKMQVFTWEEETEALFNELRVVDVGLVDVVAPDVVVPDA